MSVIEDKEVLKDGKVLKALLDKLKASKSNEDLSALMTCLMEDPYLYVPMTATMSEADAKKFTEGKVGDTITTSDAVHLKPDWLKSTDDKLYLPIFSSTDEAPEHYQNNFSWINLDLEQCLKLVDNNKEACGIVLNAFTTPLEIRDELLEIVKHQMTKANE